MATTKQKNKFLFIEEEEDGELSDSEDIVNEVEEKRKRVDSFIKDWAETVRKKKSEPNEEQNKSEMEMDSDLEDNTINVKPIAMTITFRDDMFARKNKGVIETQMIMKYGPDLVESNASCIFVSPLKASTEVNTNVAVPLGVMTVVFHDEVFCAENRQYMVSLCKELFGASKVTDDNWVIEVVQNDLLDFDVDISTHGRATVMYSLPTESIYSGEPKNNNRSGRPVSDCFNCGGQHNMSQCTQRKNFQVINRNRELFRKRKSKENTRYHAEKEKFSGLAPGHTSVVLRDALGLKSSQLPRYIYKMRKYGYPPGWLLEAKVSHSGVAVYGTKGVVPEEGDEEGEVFEEGEKDRYDIKKIIEFPGFNVPPPADTEMEHEHLDCPPISGEQDISHMIQRLAPNAYQAYKKRKAMKDKMKNEETACADLAVAPPESPSPETSKGFTDAAATPRKSVPLDVSTPEPARPIAVNLGTPVLPSASAFATLPHMDKFGVNISDVINFENLPDSTGTYDKVVKSITKIRDFFAQSRTDD